MQTSKICKRIFLHPYLLLAFCGFAWFAGFAYERNRIPPEYEIHIPIDRVVISAPLLVALYGADKYLAANLESFRLAATSFDYYANQLDVFYLVRAQRVVSQLNACHEDNYYWANGFLSHSGVIDVGNEILARASNCRVWDGIPSFLYATNLMFVKPDPKGAIAALKVAQQRWKENARGIANIIHSITANQFDDASAAIEYLEEEQKHATTERTKKALQHRINRIKGLIVLRDAQKEYEAKFGKLEYLEQLTEKNILAELPEDPLYLGYEIRGGRIEVRQLRFGVSQ